jgi:hypothetical protein
MNSYQVWMVPFALSSVMIIKMGKKEKAEKKKKGFLLYL